jgi:tetratricopeptide (TPR) repeat protein
VSNLVIPGLVLVAIVYFKVRVVLDALLGHGRVLAGDYQGALRVGRILGLGMPSAPMLHRRGLTLALEGRPVEAEACYRKVLASGYRGPISPRERLLASLGYALVDQGKFAEAERAFHEAIEAGDTTGNSQDGLAELRLIQGIESQQALHLSSQAIQHAKRRGQGRVPEVYWAHQAWALAMLGRFDEAREAIGQALFPRSHATTAARAGIHLRVARALIVMKNPAEAAEHLRKGYAIDPAGKYGRHCRETLERLNTVSV